MKTSFHNAEPPRCLSRAAAASLLGVSLRTISALLHSGELQSIKIGTRRLIPVAEIDRFIADRSAEGGDR